MKLKFVLLAAMAIGFATTASGQEALSVADKPEAEMVAPNPVEMAAAREAVSKALSAIPLRRTAGGPRILPFLDLSGQPVEIGKPLLAFQILPFVDSRGNLIPILKDGPAILPFIDLSGEPIAIGKVQRIEPISQ
jgi:hypothetical protein